MLCGASVGVTKERYTELFDVTVAYQMVQCTKS